MEQERLYVEQLEREQKQQLEREQKQQLEDLNKNKTRGNKSKILNLFSYRIK